MKSKSQKQEELERGKELFAQSNALVFVDLAQVKTKEARNLRNELKKSGNPLFVIKKRLLGLILKERGMPFEAGAMKTSVGTVFARDLEDATSTIFKFFKALEKEKKIEGEKILGGYNLAAHMPLDAAHVIMLGNLPSREVLLTQLASMIAAPVRSLLYVLKEKSQRS